MIKTTPGRVISRIIDEAMQDRFMSTNKRQPGYFVSRLNEKDREAIKGLNVSDLPRPPSWMIDESPATNNTLVYEAQKKTRKRNAYDKSR